MNTVVRALVPSLSITLALALSLAPAPGHAAPGRGGQRPAPDRDGALAVHKLAQPRTLVARGNQRANGGDRIRTSYWRWVVPGAPKLAKETTRVHQIGRAMVARTYTPGKDRTVVTQFVALRTRPPLAGEARQAAAALEQAIDLAQHAHVKPVERAKLYRDAMAGVANGLDRFTNYFDPAAWRAMQRRSAGEYVGVGIVLAPAKDGKPGVTVNKAIYRKPAYRAGVRTGDRIVKVDGRPVGDLDGVVGMLTGPKDSKVKVEIVRGRRHLTLEVARAEINSNPVRTRLAPGGIGYVRLREFAEGSAQGIRQAVDKLQGRNKGPLQGLVLDLRGNPGGRLNEATAILNDFVAKGTLVTTRERNGKVADRYRATAKTPFEKLPLAVLVDGNSASASELVSGTLRHLKRATLIGERTFGKGSVQTVIPLADGSGLTLTTAHYHVAGGKTPHEVGIQPHITTAVAKQHYIERHGQPKGRIVDYALREALHRLGAP